MRLKWVGLALLVLNLVLFSLLFNKILALVLLLVGIILIWVDCRVNEKKYVENVLKRIKRMQPKVAVDKCIMCGKKGAMRKKVELSFCDECIKKPTEEVEKAIIEYKKKLGVE